MEFKNLAKAGLSAGKPGFFAFSKNVSFFRLPG